ncbi:MAG: zinc-dependent alcohol dehydrogenase family protein [Actinobacteria bacterium]|nr:zinc-dependent alcohol dehydrogenase family protein [Actinomycetota bacterium]
MEFNAADKKAAQKGKFARKLLSGEPLPRKSQPLELCYLQIPEPGPKQILIKISACGVCRTELDQIEGRVSPPKLPIIPGHQPVGVVARLGKDVTKFNTGDRAGVTWIYSACGRCKFCIRGLENLCDEFKATGCHFDGGYAEYMVISEDYALKIPEELGDLIYVAPLMCSGVIGYRSLKLTDMEDGKTLGLYGFGSANHLVLQMSNFLYPNSKKFVLTRNLKEQELAKKLGADWAGDIKENTPEKLDCAIDTTPVWKSVVFALSNLQKGGKLVINLIRKVDTDKNLLLELQYEKHLWLEKEVKSVANVTRKDGEEFLAIAAKMRIKPRVTIYGLEEANKALVELKSGVSVGSKVLRIDYGGL